MKNLGSTNNKKDIATKEYVDNIASNIENSSNKVNSISAKSTDDQYPSAKCVYDLVGDIETILTALTTGSGV